MARHKVLLSEGTVIPMTRQIWVIPEEKTPKQKTIFFISNDTCAFVPGSSETGQSQSFVNIGKKVQFE